MSNTKNNPTLEELIETMESRYNWPDTGNTLFVRLLDNLIVRGNLYLRGTGITALPDNLTVGGWLDLSGTGITAKERRKVRRLKPNDCVEGRYIFADGILTHICGKPHKRGKYTYYNGRIKGKNVIFDGENYAHCKDFKSGVIDLQYKAAKDRGAEQYKKLNLDSVVTYNEAVIMYRVITGACSAGTAQFVNNLRERKEKYTIAEVIQITDGQYGSTIFKRFFTAKEEQK